VSLPVWLTPAAMPFAKRDLGKIGITNLKQLEQPLVPNRICEVNRKRTPPPCSAGGVFGGRSISGGRLRLAVAALLGKPAAGAAGGFGVGSVAGLFNAVGPNGVGMCGGPAVGA